MNLEEYPKEAVLRDGRKLLLRPALGEDLPGLGGLFGTLPSRDRVFVRDDDLDPGFPVSSPGAPDYRKVLPILAMAEGSVVGIGVLRRGEFPWISHVGNIRITVSPDWRRKGLGRILAGELFRSALHAGLEKIVAEVVKEQVDVGLFYTHLGFHTEAQLQGHFLDEQDSRHDIIIMSNDLRQLWKLWTEGARSSEAENRRGTRDRAIFSGARTKRDSVWVRVPGMAEKSKGKTAGKNAGKGEGEMGRKILVPIDLRGQSVKVLETAKSLMKEGDQLLLLHVVFDPSHWGGAGAPHISTEEVGRQMVEEAEKDFGKFVARYAPGASSTVRLGVPFKEILAVAKEEKVDLLVIGKRPAGGAIGSVLAPGTSKKVFSKAECDVEFVHLVNETEEDLQKKREGWL